MLLMPWLLLCVLLLKFPQRIVLRIHSLTRQLTRRPYTLIPIKTVVLGATMVRMATFIGCIRAYLALLERRMCLLGHSVLHHLLLVASRPPVARRVAAKTGSVAMLAIFAELADGDCGGVVF